MPTITFRVLEGIDKGRTFRDLAMPVTIGREEGNAVRLNDERVSRYHAKVLLDNGEIILTDLESTNGTRVNGTIVQIRRLRPGDRITIGRSQLLFGSDEEIRARMSALGALSAPAPENSPSGPVPATMPASVLAAQFDHDLDFELDVTNKLTYSNGVLFLGARPLPPLPEKMTPAQAARLAELLDFLHRHLTAATETIQANEEAAQVSLSFGDWQRILAIQLLLARYARAIAEPDVLED